MPKRSNRPKRAAVVETAKTLFLKYGIQRVRIEEVCRKTPVSKRTFYRYFRNKDGLAIAVLETLFDQGAHRMEAVLAADIPIERKIREIMALKSEMAAESSLDFYVEIMAADSEPGRFARQKQRQWDDRVRAFYRDAQRRGQIRSDLDVDLLMCVLIGTRNLLEEPALRQIQPDFPRLVESVMRLFFYGILPRSDEKAVRKGHNKRRRS